MLVQFLGDAVVNAGAICRQASQSMHLEST